MECTLALLYTLGLLPFGLALERFSSCTECYKRALLGPSHSHTLYHIPTNRSYPPWFGRMPVSDTKSPRIRKTIQATFVIKSRAMGLALGACLMLLCLVLLVLWSIRTIIEATIERKPAAQLMML
jgi:hypothetical protein